MKPSLNTLHNHAAFKLCKDSEHLKEELPGRGGSVNALLVKVEVRVLAVEFAEKGHEVLKAPTKAIN
jgi:hypothetical protein